MQHSTETFNQNMKSALVDLHHDMVKLRVAIWRRKRSLRLFVNLLAWNLHQSKDLSPLDLELSDTASNQSSKTTMELSSITSLSGSLLQDKKDSSSILWTDVTSTESGSSLCLLQPMIWIWPLTSFKRRGLTSITLLISWNRSSVINTEKSWMNLSCPH